MRFIFLKKVMLGKQWKFARGKALRVSEARFSPSRSPFPGTQLFEVVGMCGVTDRAMDAAVSGAKGWGDGWLCIVLTGWESV